MPWASPTPGTGAGPRRRGRGLGPRDPVPVWDAMGRPPPPPTLSLLRPAQELLFGPAPPLPGREPAPPPRSPPSHLHLQSVSHWPGTPARPRGAGRRAGEGARAAAEDGDSGGGREGGGGSRTHPRTDRRTAVGMSGPDPQPGPGPGRSHGARLRWSGVGRGRGRGGPGAHGLLDLLLGLHHELSSAYGRSAMWRAVPELG